MSENSQTIIVSVGGSLLVPDAIDTTFITKLRDFLLSEIEKGRKFVLVVGGGKTARKYRDAAKAFNLSEDDLDEIGIRATRLNAYLFKKTLGSITHDEIILDPTVQIETDKPVIVAGGYKPGATTDWVSTLLANNLGAKKVVNLTNTDYVCSYNEDGSVNFDDPIKEMSWSDFRNLIPNGHSAGANLPFDPVGSQVAEENGLEVVIINGDRLAELSNYLDGKAFTGTVIK